MQRAYRTFVRCHEITRRAATESSLLEEVCTSAVNELGYRLAWIGFVGPDGVVNPVAQAGYEQGYLDSIRITVDEGPQGNGPTGRAIRTRQTAICQEIATDERFAPWRADAIRRGYGSSCSIPLTDGSRCLGALNLYAAESQAFVDEEVVLLEEVAVNLVVGLLRLRAHARERELELRLARAARVEATNETAAALAHDVNNLLVVVLMGLESARSVPAPPAVQLDVERGLDAAGRASRMMMQFLALSRRAQVTDTAGETDVDDVITSTRGLLARLAPRARLEFHTGAPAHRVRMTPVDLERTLINLVVNAAHAAPDGGTISVSTAPFVVPVNGMHVDGQRLEEGPHVELVVRDQGTGMTAETLARVFEPFFTTKGDEGTGLGLPSVLRAARGCGGAVTIQSRPGAGTRVAVFIPVSERVTSA